MKIEKEYDVQELANKVKGSIKMVYETKTRYANIDVITAQEIVDVLETVVSWENKDKKPSNISDEERCEKKKTLCDDCLMRYCCNADCTNEHITKQMLGDLAECFGKSYGKRYTAVCKTCKYKEQCKELTKHE